MTTDFVGVPANWTVKQTLDYIHDVGENREVVTPSACSTRKRSAW